VEQSLFGLLLLWLVALILLSIIGGFRRHAYGFLIR
jgi:hypothetical protein